MTDTYREMPLGFKIAFLYDHTIMKLNISFKYLLLVELKYLEEAYAFGND
jgi:hypothetical protein